jgi:hypothetical protein
MSMTDRSLLMALRLTRMPMMRRALVRLRALAKP